MDKFEEMEELEFEDLSRKERISGPLSISKFLVGGREIYIFGDLHTGEGIKCSGECTLVGIDHLPVGNRNSDCNSLTFCIYKFTKYCREKYPNDFVDLYVESPYFTKQIYDKMFPKYNEEYFPDLMNLKINIKEPRIMYGSNLKLKSKLINPQDKEEYFDFVSELFDGKYYELWYTFSACFERYLGEKIVDKCLFSNLRYHHVDIRETLPYNYHYGDLVDSFFDKNESYMDILISAIENSHSNLLIDDAEYICSIMKKLFSGKKSFTEQYIKLCMKSNNFINDTEKFRNVAIKLMNNKSEAIKLYFGYFLEYLKSDLLLVEDGEHLIKRNIKKLTDYLQEDQIYDYFDQNYEYDKGFKGEETFGLKYLSPISYLKSIRLTLGSLIMKHDSIKMDIYAISKLISGKENSKYAILVTGEEHASKYTNFISKYIKIPTFYAPPRFQKIGNKKNPLMCVDGTHLPFSKIDQSLD